MNGISVLIKEMPGSALFPSATSRPREGTPVYEPDAESTGTLVLGFPGSRTVRNKCLLLKPSSLWYFCYSSWNGLRHHRLGALVIDL